MKQFFTLLLWLTKLVRKVYDPILYWFMKTFFLEDILEEEACLNPNKFNNKIRFDLDFELIVKQLKWIREPLGGLFDFTYRDYRYFISDDVTLKYGRDCDDFSYFWFMHFKEKDIPVYQILLTVPKLNSELFSRAHFITVAECPDAWYICDNNRKITLPTKDKTNLITLTDIMNYYSRNEYREEVVWVVYRRKNTYADFLN